MFKELDKYCEKLRFDYKAMVFTYIIDTGFREISETTDEDVAEMRKALKEKETGREIMTVDFQVDLVNTAREIVRLCENPVELYQYSAIKGIFDLDYYAPGELSPREEILYELVRDFSNSADYDEIDESLERFERSIKNDI